MSQWDLGAGCWFWADTFDAMAQLPDGSVDMILCDLPYGTTACSWDTVIPFEPLWREYWRVCKPNAAVVLTASQPFTSALIMSQPDFFRYLWVWDKISVTGFANAKRQPLRHSEDCLVFYRTPPSYFPQGLEPLGKTRKNSATDGGATVKGTHTSNGAGALRTAGLERTQEFTNYPRQRLEIGRERGFHPTQKPVALFEYLIRTYTNPGELVLDNTAGSGTTAIAAEQSGRRWVCIERDLDYSLAAMDRIARHVEARVAA